MLFLIVLAFQDWSWLDNNRYVAMDTGATNLVLPLEVSCDADGFLYLADVKANAVFKVSPQGEILFSFGRTGQGPGEFTSVYDVAVDKRRKRVWVSDQIGRRLACYDTDGTLLVQRNITEIQPYSIVCRNDGTIVVGGTGSYNFAVYDEHLNLVKQFGEPMKTPMKGALLEDMLRRYMTMAIDQDDRLYVAYTSQPLVVCYDREGLLLWSTRRSWLADDPPIKATSNGMNFQSEDYHMNCFLMGDVFYATTWKKELRVVAFNRESGAYLGARKLDKNLYLRGIAFNDGLIFSLDPSEGLFRVHEVSKKPAFSALHIADNYENRYRVSAEVAEGVTASAQPCGAMSGCQCSSGEGKCGGSCGGSCAAH